MVLHTVKRLLRRAVSALSFLPCPPALRGDKWGWTLLSLQESGNDSYLPSFSAGNSTTLLGAAAAPGRFISLWRWSWALLLLYGEVLCFYVAAWNCSWPTRSGWQSSSSSATPFEHPSDVFHVALIADPQLTDRTAYGQEGQLLWLTEYFTDYYMLRSERALRFVNRPDAYFVLGDLFNGGRDLQPTEWDRELRRFTTIFPLAGKLFADGRNGTAPYHVIAGNHDFGLGDDVVSKARSRFRELFGPTTRQISLANHMVVVVDSVALAGRRSDYDEGSLVKSPAVVEVENLLSEVASDESSDPRRRILLTHIPLYRPPAATCGPLRRAGTRIPNVRGYQWQNLLDHRWAERILKSVKPAVVFSGDDHDYCEQRHPVPGLPDAVEYTIPTFSFAQGNFHPGTGFLSLNPSAGDDIPSWAVTLCPMVRQFCIYGTYAVVFVATMLCVCVRPCGRRFRLRGRRSAYRHLEADYSFGRWDGASFGEISNGSEPGGTFLAWPGKCRNMVTGISAVLADACLTLLKIIWPPLLWYFLFTFFWWIS